MSLEKAKQHYSELLKGSKIEIEIPEWGTTIYMRPIQNLSVSTASKVRKSIAKDDALGAAECIHYLATTSAEDTGDKFAFGGNAALHDLKYKVDAGVVMKVFTTWIEESTKLASGEAKKIKKQ